MKINLFGVLLSLLLYVPTPAPTPAPPYPEPYPSPPYWSPWNEYEYYEITLPIIINGCVIGNDDFKVYGHLNGFDNDKWVVRLGKYLYTRNDQMYFYLSPSHSPASILIDGNYSFENIHCGSYVIILYKITSGEFYLLDSSPFKIKENTIINGNIDELVYIVKLY